MVTRVTGLLERVEGTVAVVGMPAAGLAYEVLMPVYLAARLRAARGPDGGGAAISYENAPITLHTIEYLEGQGQGTSFIPRIIGFGSIAEREFFELFTTVKGLGNKRALRALAIEPGAIAEAIVARDARRLQELPEIGKKLAETIVLELRDKAQRFIGTLGGGEGRAPSAEGPPGEIKDERFSAAAIEAISAIVTLGETEAGAERMVASALRRSPQLATPEDIVSAAYASR